jgi:hypothetical protein
LAKAVRQEQMEIRQQMGQKALTQNLTPKRLMAAEAARGIETVLPLLVMQAVQAVETP